MILDMGVNLWLSACRSRSPTRRGLGELVLPDRRCLGSRRTLMQPRCQISAPYKAPSAPPSWWGGRGLAIVCHYGTRVLRGLVLVSASGSVWPPCERTAATLFAMTNRTSGSGGRLQEASR